jgi:adenylate cyclase
VGFARKFVRSRGWVSVVITTAVFAFIAVIRSTGKLERLELGAYDVLLRSRPLLTIDDNPIVLIKLREEEIQKYGHPLCDARMAVALAKLQDLGARAIGVDIYRDNPVTSCTGRVGSLDLPDENTDLADVVLRDDRVVMLEVPDGEDPTAPPQFLEGSGQIAFPSIPVDPNGIVHRALMSFVHEDIPRYSMSFMLAFRYLHAEGIYLVNDPDQPEFLRLGETVIPNIQPNHGGYHAIDTAGYQYMLDYSLGHGGFPSFTLEELYSDSIPAEALRGKVALLGTESSTVKDEFYTALSASLPGDPFMLGMELHAHATLQLIRFAHGEAKPLGSWSEGWEYGWTLLWCALGGLLGCWNRSIWLSVIAGGAGLISLGVASSAALGSYLWIPVVPPLLAGVAAAGLVTTYRAIIERTERSEVTGLFSKFLRPEVAEAIWGQRDQFIGPDDRPRAQSITLTSLMSDLQGYTTASESMGAEALMEWINHYMMRMANLVGEYGGVVDDYAGDGIKANFGFPIPHDTKEAIDADARNAVSCALAMGEAMDRLNEEWRERDLPTGRVRVGIYTGPAVVGILGGGKSMKYTTVGDTVNTAARLESFAKDDFSSNAERADWRILIGSGTMERLDGAFRTLDLGSHAVKGKNEMIRIFRVLGRSDADGSSMDSDPS